MKPVVNINITLDNKVYEIVDGLKKLYAADSISKEELIKNVQVAAYDNLVVEVCVGKEVEEEEKKELSIIKWLKGEK